MWKSKTIANRLLKFALVINSATLLLPDNLKGAVIITLLSSSIYYYIVFGSHRKMQLKHFYISIAFYALLLLSILYSENMDYAFKKLETSLSLFVFPLIFVLIHNCKVSLSKNFLNTLFWVYIIALFTYLISTFTYFFLTEPYYTFKSTIVHYRTLVDLRIKNYEIHSIYLSMYIGIGIILLINFISNATKKKKKSAMFLLIVFLIFLAILYKRGPIISLGILGILALVKNKINLKFSVFFIALTIAFVSFMAIVPKFKGINNFKEVFDIKNLRDIPNSSTAIRLSIYDCGLKQAKKAPLFGHGWGDVKDVLMDCYKNEKPQLLALKYNSHNQYLSIFLSIGIVGLLLFLYYFYYTLSFANKNSNKVLFFMLLYFGLNMLSENIIEREDGVILFAFFINLLLFNTHLPTKKIKEHN